MDQPPRLVARAMLQPPRLLTRTMDQSARLVASARSWRQGVLDSAGPWGRRCRTGRHDSGWREVIAGAGESYRREG